MNKTILCPFYFEKTLLENLRCDDPFLDVKFIDKESILHAYFGQFKKESVPFLMKKYNLKRSTVRNYMKYLGYLKANDCFDNEKVALLNKYRNDLIANHFFKKDDYFLNLLKNKEVDIYGYSKNDKELIKVLDVLNCKYNFISTNIKKDKISVKTFDNSKDEIHSLMIDICKLINSGVDINDIYIHGIDDEYYSTFIRYAKLYNIPFNNGKAVKLKDFDFGKEFEVTYLKNKNFDETLSILDDKYDKNPDYLIYRQALIDSYDEEYSYEQQAEIFENIDVEKNVPIFDKAVTLLDNFTLLNNKHIFVVGFSQGKYPIVKKDNDFLPDKIKNLLDIPTSLDETIINKDLALLFLNSNNIFHLSFSYKVGFNVKYLSFLIQNFDYELKPFSIPMEDYSEEVAKYELIKMSDLARQYRQIKPELKSYKKKFKIDYFTYNNEFKPFNAISKNKILRHSYSSLDKYVSCPFAYYLEKVLGLNTFEDNFSTKFGSAMHAVLEKGLKDRNTNFEDLFNENIVKYEFTPKEMVFVNNLKQQIKTAFNVSRNQIDRIRSPKLFLEQEMYYKLNDKSYLIGYIDKMMVTDDKFVSVVDYKTTDKITFNMKLVQYGLNMQLPIYSLLTQKDPKFENYTFAGMYIMPIVYKDLHGDVIDDEQHPEHFLLNGKSLADPNYLSDMEPGYFDHDIRYIKLTAPKDVNNYDKNHTIDKKAFDDITSMVENYVIKIDENIRNSKFPIKPYIRGTNDACKHCKFKDICFVNKKQYREITVAKGESDGSEVE